MTITPAEIRLLAEQIGFKYGVTKDQALEIVAMVLDQAGVQPMEELQAASVFAATLDIMSGKGKPS